MSTVIVSAYGPKMSLKLVCDAKEDVTKQSFAKECDINTIMSRYRKTGVLEFVNQHDPQFLDVTGADFRAAMDVVALSRENFALLPAEIRKRFANDPAVFLEAWDDPARDVEFQALGLKPKPAPAPEVSPEPAAAPAAAPA